MAKKLKGLTFDYRAWDAMRQSPEVQAALMEHASRIQAAAQSMAGGAEFEVELVQMPTRTVAFVQAASAEAARECADHNVLLKAVGV